MKHYNCSCHHSLIRKTPNGYKEIISCICPHCFKNFKSTKIVVAYKEVIVEVK